MDDIVNELVADGQLTRAQATAMTLPVYLRTPDEYLRPLETGGAVDVYRTEVVEAPLNPMEDRFEATGDAREFAQAIADSARAWVGTCLFGHLPTEPAGVEDV